VLFHSQDGSSGSSSSPVVGSISGRSHFVVVVRWLSVCLR
jgi:hypothetical protein